MHNIMAKRDGFEPVDDRPVALPVGVSRPTEADRLHGLMQRLFLDMRNQNEVDTFEDSLDFDVEDDDDLPVSVSQSEMRYMKEERLLTEAEEAARVVAHRRDALTWKEKYYGKRSADERGKGSDSDGFEVAGGERGQASKQSTQQRSDARTTEKAGE